MVRAGVSAGLTAMFGIKPYTDTLHGDHEWEPSLEPHAFSAFGGAAAEATVSRLYGGIDFPAGIEQDFMQGRCIGQVILDRLQLMRERARV